MVQGLKHCQNQKNNLKIHGKNRLTQSGLQDKRKAIDIQTLVESVLI